MSISVKDVVDRVLNEIRKFVVDEEQSLELLLLAILTQSHCIVFGPPGSAKTMTVKLLAQLLGLRYSRIQFTPDILPSDIIGARILDPKTGNLRTVLGPIYANVVLADEINRSNPKSLAALLEAMQERQITIEGEMYKLPKPFVVLATLNPFETYGIFPLPMAVLDRFALSIRFDYPEHEEELEIVRRSTRIDIEEVELSPIIKPDIVMQIYNLLKEVKVSNDVVDYAVKIVRSVRAVEDLVLRPSPRASVHLIKLARCRALIEGRDYVIPDDVKNLAIPVLRHRVVFRDTMDNMSRNMDKAEALINKILQSIEPPW